MGEERHRVLDRSPEDEGFFDRGNVDRLEASLPEDGVDPVGVRQREWSGASPPVRGCGGTWAAAAAGMMIQSFRAISCQHTKVSLPSGRKACPMFENPATGSAKNIAPNRLRA
jgi:hypothetical protein